MKLYFEAEKYIRDTSEQNGSLQSRIFNDSKLTNSPKHVYALVVSCLEYKAHINKIITKSKIKQSKEIKKAKVSDGVLLLVVHDLIFSAKGRIQLGKHPIKDAILAHKTRLQSELVKLKLKHKVTQIDQLPDIKKIDETPIRWIRINTIKISPQEFIDGNKWFLDLNPVYTIGDISSPGVVYKDTYIDNLYGLHPQEKIMTTAAYKNGEFIIQDRASCFPGAILFGDNENLPHQVIDACAAPGNKTTHVASYLKALAPPHSVVYAFERDSNRVKTLRKMCDIATNPHQLVQITHADFTSIDVNDFGQVQALVVDPSCSGSGIFGRALEDGLEQERASDDRLDRLSRFQFKIMKHALQFPNATRVVYSTCSIHPQENERVVVDLLLDAEMKLRGWRLAPRRTVLPQWPRRGWEEEFTALLSAETSVQDLAGGCVRAVANEDGGIGFFAACFVRGEPEPERKEEYSDWEGFA